MTIQYQKAYHKRIEYLVKGGKCPHCNSKVKKVDEDGLCMSCGGDPMFDDDGNLLTDHL